MELVCGGMFQTSQCVNNPPGASGSSAISARVFAPEGTSPICNGGLVSPPSHVNFDGMLSPSRKAELVIFILAPPAAKEALAARKAADTLAEIRLPPARP